MLTYTVRRGFQHGDTWYTRENAEAVKELPRAVRDELIEQGTIEEHEDRAKPTEPAAPATTGKGK